MNLLSHAPIMMLTRSTTAIIGPISDVLAVIMNYIFDFVYGITQYNSLGISIIFFTIIVKLILMPLMINQQKSMRKFQKVQPQMQKIQAKYKNKKDPESQQKMQKELQEFYKEHKVNPMGGCLPLLLQMPIFFALFNVLRNVPAYINYVGDIFTRIGTEIMDVSNYTEILAGFDKIIPQIKGYDPTQINSVMDVLSKLTDTQWAELSSKLPDTTQLAIQADVALQHQINFFLGFNLAEAPGWALPGIIFPILAGLTTFLQSKLMASKTSNDNQQAAQTQKTMNMIFPFMTAFFTATMPAGLGIYWIVSNLFSIAQQIIINQIMDKEDSADKAKNPVK